MRFNKNRTPTKIPKDMPRKMEIFIHTVKNNPFRKKEQDPESKEYG